MGGKLYAKEDGRGGHGDLSRLMVLASPRARLSHQACGVAPTETEYLGDLDFVCFSFLGLRNREGQ
jgi:hypothetical protein